MGAYYLSLRASEDKALPLSLRQKKMLGAARTDIESCFVREGMIPAILFRIGRGAQPSARSLKKIPSVTFS
jgi:hypothetical protein